MPGNFFDTNVLVYLLSRDATRADRVEHALSHGGTVSVQVLNELANVSRRKLRLPWNDTYAFLALLRGLLTVNPVTVEVHDMGLRLAERYGMPICDAMIAASALDAGCDTLLSEDFQNGLVVKEGLRVTNPFL
ncbi:pilus assembly protein [Bradyrhizobium centrolobii]|uniref:Pilus assembly protein n=1 Tax=Bradyrhizobium centrolobii TaxID=1505087 RepID=A0A176Y8N4_9BRAD|nr:PIN domain-containing protein [Bradyrhizobium centrolobii]OAE97450.1 pilus assembly protein [Bradyrhizobium centrolobii]